jgi:hypothetical protein
VGAFVVMALFDLWLLLRGAPTMSDVLQKAAHKWPILAFAAGVLAGHLFWGE